MRDVIVKEDTDKKDARNSSIERRARAIQAAALIKLSQTHHHFDD
jgi:hypothetical protein